MKISGAKTLPAAPARCCSSPSRVSNGRPNVWRFVQASLDDDSKVVGEDDFLRRPAAREGRQAERRSDGRLAARGQEGRARAARLHVTVDRAAARSSRRSSRARPARPASSKVGDVITSIDGQPVRLADDVGTIVRAQAGRHRRSTFTVTRKGRDARPMPVTTRAAPERRPRRASPTSGSRRSPRTCKLDFPVEDQDRPRRRERPVGAGSRSRSRSSTTSRPATSPAARRSRSPARSTSTATSARWAACRRRRPPRSTPAPS